MPLCANFIFVDKGNARAGSDDMRVSTIHPERRLLMWLVITMSATFLVFQNGAVTGYDGGTMYQVTKSIVDRHTLAVSKEWNTLPGRGGLRYSRYGLGLSLVAAIPYVLVRPVANRSHHPEEFSAAAVASAIPITTAALVAALYLLARRMGARVGAALLVAVGAVVGTFVLPYSKEFFSEPLAALGLVLAIERLLADRPATAGLALGAAVLTRPQLLLFVPVFVLFAWRRQAGAGLLRAIAGLTPGLVATFGYNFVRFGNPLSFGYQDVGFTTPFLKGAGGLLFEPTKSVLLFAPIVVLFPFALRHLWRKRRSAFWLVTANLAIAFVFTATWFAWHGGWCWGPRLLIPGLLPTIAAIGPWLSTLARHRVAVLLLGAGFVVSFPALIVSTQAQQLEVKAPPPQTHFLDTQPLFSPSIPRQFELIIPTARFSVEHPFEGLREGRNDLHYLSLWQVAATRVIGAAGLPLSAAGTALLLVVAVAGYRKLRVAVREVTGSDSAPGVEDSAPGASYPGASNLEAMESAAKYHRFLTAAVLARADPTRPVLDFGAGTGRQARSIRDRGSQVSCVEPDPAMRRQLELDGFPVAATVGALGPAAFGSIYSLNVLEHIEDDVGALRDLFSATEPGGRLILYVPAFPILFSAMDRRVGHLRRYRKKQLIGLVRGAGFRVTSCTHVDSLGFGAALAYRWFGGTGDLNPKTVARYDRFAFPLSRILDHLVARFLGKNLLLVARRD
jgi:SAM-dependent methyltransferase